jgi:beta-phosphoglucomutase-like phosphatase (HAD superfamily)
MKEVREVGFEVFSFTSSLLQEIKKKRKKIVIVSANCHDTLKYVFESANLLRYVDVICARDDVTRTKPHPAHFECALKMLGIGKIVGKNKYCQDM